ncbi:MAG TPA: hypothetical protein VK453_12000 [Micromonosporaceae bacterium]|nr:hypothetical protein [Micromonosporaceae bacterium]
MLSAALLPTISRALGVGRFSLAGYLSFAGAVTALAATTHYPAAVPLWLAWNFASAAAIVNGITVRQQLTADHRQGRVNTTGRMIAWGGTPFGALLGGIIAGTHGVATAYLCLTIPTGLAVLLLFASSVPRVKTSAGAS